MPSCCSRPRDCWRREPIRTSSFATHFAAGVLSSDDRDCLETMRAKARWLAGNPGQAGMIVCKSFGAFHRRMNMGKGLL